MKNQINENKINSSVNNSTRCLFISKTTWIGLVIVMIFSFPVYAQFAHPGIQHKKSDLERAKYGIEAGAEPWASSFENLKQDVFSSYSYTVQGNLGMTSVERNGINGKAYENDMNAAYLNALMYWFTDDQRHADKAIEILNTWSNLTSVGGIPLNVGLYGAPMINAAELIKHSNAGWSEEDVQKFSDMLVYPGYSNTTIPQEDIDAGNHTFYWGVYNGDPGRAGNQELAAYKTMIAIGIFLDNKIIYDRAVRYVCGKPHRSDDFPYEPGPKTATSVIAVNPYRTSYNWTQQFTIPDYGYDGVITNYIYENGQSQESARDQVHAMYGISLTAQIAEIAWNQGDDLYSLAENRILAGLEYGAKYNLSYLQSYPDQSTPWEPTVETGEFIQRYSRTARTFNKQICPVYENDEDRLSRGVNIGRPYWEQPFQHYKNRMNLPDSDYLWLERVREYNIAATGAYEIRSESPTDSPGWGALNFGRVTGGNGDPISGFDSNGIPKYNMNILPMTIEAENFDYFTVSGEGYTYGDMSDSNISGEYRSDESVDIKICSEGGYNIEDIDSGEWLTYTVNVPSSGTYDISIRYAAANGNGKIQFNIGGEDVTPNVDVPFEATASKNLIDWKDFTVATNVFLSKGVQVLKVFFSGADNSFELNNITIDVNTLQADLDSGEFEFLFDTDNNFEGWSSFNNPESTIMDVSSGVLKASYLNTLGYFAIQHQSDLEFGAEYPYLAIKIDHLPEKRMSLYMASGWYNNDKGGFSSLSNTILNHVGIYVYDLSTNGPGFGSGGTQVFASRENYIDTNRVIFLIDDGNTTESTNANYNDIEWIKNFASIQDIIEYEGLSLSLHDVKQDLISIYPNPFTDTISITNSMGANMEIFNAQGGLLYSAWIEKDKYEVDTNNFSNGIYFVRIIHKGVVTTKKIIKNK